MRKETVLRKKKGFFFRTEKSLESREREQKTSKRVSNTLKKKARRGMTIPSRGKPKQSHRRKAQSKTSNILEATSAVKKWGHNKSKSQAEQSEVRGGNKRLDKILGAKKCSQEMGHTKAEGRPTAKAGTRKKPEGSHGRKRPKRTKEKPESGQEGNQGRSCSRRQNVRVYFIWCGFGVDGGV